MPLDKPPAVEIRNAPQQSRAHKTISAILCATADLLEEGGFEQLSTNQICRRAKLTPPALYHYFPNKYAVMHELGERLFLAQRDALISWEAERTHKSVEAEDIEALLKTVIAATKAQTAGVLIMRSLHASPNLSELRLKTLRVLTDFLTQRALRMHPALNEEATFVGMRLGVEMGYSVIELLVDEKEINIEATIKAAADTLTYNWRRCLQVS